MTSRSRAAILAESIVIVLNEPQDIVNIAGTVRSMMNMGLRRLRVVRPALYDAYRVAGIAHGSEAFLEGIEFPDTLGEALSDATRVVGNWVGTNSKRCNLGGKPVQCIAGCRWGTAATHTQCRT